MIEMNKKIFYWSPCLNPVGTIKSTVNSAISLKKYGFKKYDVFLINACGEWDDYLSQLRDNDIKILKLNFSYFEFLPKRGYIQSRISYIIIFLLSFLPLLRLLKKHKPNFIISHLITSLPLSLLLFFKFKTKFILRISGFPKLNLIRKNFWKFISSKLFCVTTPTEELKSKLIDQKIFINKNIFFLPDAILHLKKIIKKKSESVNELKKLGEKSIIISAGRLTKQKNFSYLIKEFKKFSETNDDFILIILGDGEEKKKLQKLIKTLNIEEKVYLKGHVDNVYKYFKIGKLFVLSSKWEEVGFVIVEAAISNLFVVSSNCPNGPTEFLDNGRNGILYENNQKGALCEALQKFVFLKNIDQIKLRLKKNADKYTIFKHFITLDKIIKK